MPCRRCSNGKYKFGRSDCKYTSKANCRKVEAAYYAQRNDKKKTK